MNAAGWVHIAWACLAVMVALGMAAPVMKHRDRKFARREAFLDAMAREVRRRDQLRDERGYAAAEIDPLLPSEAEAFEGIAARVRFPDDLAGQIKAEINEEEAA